MKWSYQIGTLSGIPVKIHITFLLIAVVLPAYAASLGGWIGAAAMIVVLFGSVVLHELGHALAARRYGIGTRDITLLPIGGLAMLNRMPDDAKQEIVIAAAGPATSFLLAGVGALVAIPLAGTWLGERAAHLMVINVILGTFNLIPALPMDGGRIFRGALALWQGRTKATRIASSVAKVFAVLFVIAGLVTKSTWLPVIGVLVWIFSSSEQRHEAVRSRFRHLTVGQVMTKSFHALTPETMIGSAADVALRSLQDEFPVVRAGLVEGTVSARAIQSAMLAGRNLEPVGNVAEPVRRFVGIDTPLSELISEVGGGALPVLDGGRLVGLVFPRNLVVRAAG